VAIVCILDVRQSVNGTYGVKGQEGRSSYEVGIGNATYGGWGGVRVGIANIDRKIGGGGQLGYAVEDPSRDDSRCHGKNADYHEKP
jgi:hypothetical protein